MANPYHDHNLALLAHLRGILLAMGETEQVSEESHALFLERFDELIMNLKNVPEERHMGQDMICQVFHRYPQIAHLVPRDLLWYFGGDCLHFMPDEEIEIFQRLEERRYEAEENDEPFDWNMERQLMSFPDEGPRLLASSALADSGGLRSAVCVKRASRPPLLQEAQRPKRHR